MAPSTIFENISLKIQHVCQGGHSGQRLGHPLFASNLRGWLKQGAGFRPLTPDPQKGGAWSLRPEMPPSIHVGFLMRSYPRWWRRAIQAEGPGSPPKIQDGGGAIQALGPAGPQQIYVGFLMKSSTTLCQIFKKNQKNQLLHLFIHIKIRKQHEIKKNDSWFIKNNKKKERKKERKNFLCSNKQVVFLLVCWRFVCFWLFSFFLFSFLFIMQIIF